MLGGSYRVSAKMAQCDIVSPSLGMIVSTKDCAPPPMVIMIICLTALSPPSRSLRAGPVRDTLGFLGVQCARR